MHIFDTEKRMNTTLMLYSSFKETLREGSKFGRPEKICLGSFKSFSVWAEYTTRAEKNTEHGSLINFRIRN